MDQIEISILKGLLYDGEYCRKVMPYLKPEYFEGSTKNIFQNFSAFYNKHNKVPTTESLIIMIQKQGYDENTYGEIVEIVESCIKSKKVVNDTEWLVNETEEYCRNRALYDSIYTAINILEGNEKKLSEGAIPELLEKSLAISFDTSIGSDYIDDAMKRYDWYTSEETKIAFKLAALNYLSNNGLPPKTLNVLLGGTNGGKSSLMCFNAAEWLREGKNVLYFTMEMSEEAITERVDMNLMDMDSNQLRNLKRDSFISKIKELSKKGIGRLKVKEFPTGEPNANHFKAVMKELKQKQGFEADVVIIDYINICSSVRFSAGGSNSYSYIKSIAEELRGLAVSENVAVLTATQINREGTTKTDPGMDNISDSFGIAMTADWICAISATEKLVEEGKVLATLLKTRYGSKTNMKSVVFGVDYNRMRYHDLNEESDFQKTISKQKQLKEESSSDTPLSKISWD